MTPEERAEIVSAMRNWWDQENGFVEADPKGAGIDHPLDWHLIVDKVLLLGDAADAIQEHPIVPKRELDGEYTCATCGRRLAIASFEHAQDDD